MEYLDVCVDDCFVFASIGIHFVLDIVDRFDLILWFLALRVIPYHDKTVDLLNIKHFDAGFRYFFP